MKITALLLALVGLLLTGCGGSVPVPPLAVTGQPTLVFIYTDN
jgi:hypothetical protein